MMRAHDVGCSRRAATGTIMRSGRSPKSDCARNSQGGNEGHGEGTVRQAGDDGAVGAGPGQIWWQHHANRPSKKSIPYPRRPLFRGGLPGRRTVAADLGIPGGVERTGSGSSPRVNTL